MGSKAAGPVPATIVPMPAIIARSMRLVAALTAVSTWRPRQVLGEERAE